MEASEFEAAIADLRETFQAAPHSFLRSRKLAVVALRNASREGKSRRTAAEGFGVNLSSGKRWKRAWSDGVVAGVSVKPHPAGVPR